MHECYNLSTSSSTTSYCLSFIFAILEGVKWYLLVILVLISLIINSVEHEMPSFRSALSAHPSYWVSFRKSLLGFLLIFCLEIVVILASWRLTDSLLDALGPTFGQVPVVRQLCLGFEVHVLPVGRLDVTFEAGIAIPRLAKLLGQSQPIPWALQWVGLEVPELIPLKNHLRGHLLHPSAIRQLEPLTHSLSDWRESVIHCFKNPCRKKFHWPPLPTASILAAFCVRKVLCSDSDPTFCNTYQFPLMLSFLGGCERQMLPRRGFILWSDQTTLAGEALIWESPDQVTPLQGTWRLNDLVTWLYCLSSLLEKETFWQTPGYVFILRLGHSKLMFQRLEVAVQAAWWVVIKYRWRPSGQACPSQPAKWGLACPPQSWLRKRPMWRQMVYMCMGVHAHPYLCVRVWRLLREVVLLRCMWFLSLHEGSPCCTVWGMGFF